MKVLALAAAAITLALGTVGGAATAQTVPNRETCEGYPEKRVYLENQSWFEPQHAVTPASPNTGKQGHIHVGTCFPLYQHIDTTDPNKTIRFDFKVQLHNVSQTMPWFFVHLYGDTHVEINRREWPSSNGQDVGWRCDVADCSQWLTMEFPIGQAKYKGFHAMLIEALMINPVTFASTDWYSLTQNWPLYIDNPNLPDPPAGSTVAEVAKDTFGVGGDSWILSEYLGEGAYPSKYSRASIAKEDFPWDPVTGQLKPVSGVWEPMLQFDRPGQFVTIDPHLHANPVDMGKIQHQAEGQPAYSRRRVSIDTTQLSNGVHRLMIASSNGGAKAKHTGVLVIPLLVQNGATEPPPNPCADLEQQHAEMMATIASQTATIDAYRLRIAEKDARIALLEDKLARLESAFHSSGSSNRRLDRIHAILHE